MRLAFILAFFAVRVFAQPSHILIFSKNASYAYRHASIEHGVAQLKKYCESKGMKVETSENADLFTDDNLKRYRCLVFLSANQDIFDAKQEAALQRYIRAGGGFVGIHSSSGVERNWHWFNKMLGATFKNHPPQQSGSIKIIDKKHPSTKFLPTTWNRFDEWYYFGPIKNPIKILAVLDSSTFKSDKHTQNYPSAWYQDFEGGKSFYTAGGHNNADFDDPLFLLHIYGGITSTLTKKLDYSKNDKYKKAPARIITLDPGHFHAALVQKVNNENLDKKVKIYGPAGPDLSMHLDRINSYNKRAEDPTQWQVETYSGDDYLSKMISKKEGDIVVMAGNNASKTANIYAALNAGLNVLADKPMCIDKQGYELLKNCFEKAKEKELLLYDIMTERSEINTILQKELSLIPVLFGQLQKGTVEDPAIIKESVHHFYKFVSGAPLIRPAWFMDTKQQGQGIVDVTTHLVDLVHWAAFPNTPLEVKDAKVLAARKWATNMGLSEFKLITGLKSFPEYLKKDLKNDTSLAVNANGEIDFKLKDIHAKVRVLWNYSTNKGGDTHYSIMKGTKANLEIRQGEMEQFIPQLYIKNSTLSETALNAIIENLKKKYEGISLSKHGNEYRVDIPAPLRTSHETHFAEVMARYLEFYEVNNLPDWETANMLLKYYVTTEAAEMTK